MSFEQCCPGCGRWLTVPDKAVGKRLTCPSCNERFLATQPTDSYGAAPPPPVYEPPPIPPIPPTAPQTAAPPPPLSQTKPCPFCAETIAAGAIKCRFCGSLLTPLPTGGASSSKWIQPRERPHDPLAVAILSACCLAGSGQMVLGQTVKGVVILVGALCLGVLTGGVSVLVTWPLIAIDAYLVARKLKDGQPVTEWESFPT